MARLPSDSSHISLHNEFAAYNWTALVKIMGILSASGSYSYLIYLFIVLNSCKNELIHDRVSMLIEVDPVWTPGIHFTRLIIPLLIWTEERRHNERLVGQDMPSKGSGFQVILSEVLAIWTAIKSTSFASPPDEKLKKKMENYLVEEFCFPEK
ncbi:hypothetical protein TURU_143828 [Turdus rufiventris]|nr:hypothetical protein TURU_143828 [Turdus rufiventris]